MPDDIGSFLILECLMPETKKYSASGSVRVDLVGGTLDLEPINLILPNVATLNVATSLKANVDIIETSNDTVEIESLDYKTNYKFSKIDFTYDNLYQSDFFKEMTFVCQILDLFKINSKVKVVLSSGAPAGSGLGGSSAMGVTLYKALCLMTKTTLDIDEAVLKVKGCESRILNQGVPGYQDYFPALCGGILALRGRPGKIEREQLFSLELKDFLESRITLVYSGITRNSGINNWDVYKGFFDGDKNIRSCMNTIAEISFQTYKGIRTRDFEMVLDLIGKEGQARETLAEGITPEPVKEFYKNLKLEVGSVGMKMCGAGGGGCFILTHRSEDAQQISESITRYNMTKLDFLIEEPLEK